jgi:two-component system, chemotaxis family, chemotaxis protein CheY
MMTDYKTDWFFGSLTGNGRVLVVDDEPTSRTVVRAVLEKAGYDVLEADNGKTAVAAINTGENRLMLDAVICDNQMQKISGFDAMAYFRREFSHVPLVVLTGCPDIDAATSLLREGVVDYLIKPVDGTRLTVAMAQAMERRDMAWR